MSRRDKAVPMLPEEQKFLEDFYTKYRRFLFYVAGQYTRRESEKEDVVQDAMVRLLRNVSKLMDMNDPQLRKYTALTVRASFLDRERRKEAHLFEDDKLLEKLLGKEREMVPDLYLRWEVAHLRQMLTHREWLALEGKYILGYSQEELGALLGISPDSVRMVLCRVREKAREILYSGSVTGGDGHE